MRQVALILTLNAILLLDAHTYGQASPSLEETQSWIIGKIQDYTYKGNEPYNTYKVWFNNGLMQFKYTTGSGTIRLEDFGTVNIEDIQYISYSRFENTIWLNIHLAENRDPRFNTNAFESINKEGKLSFILNKNFDTDDLPSRMRRAFSNLVKMNGGELRTMTEPY